MTLDQEEKDRLAQLGKDRKLAEAVGALDTTASEFLRIAGDENSEEDSILQAASNYRAAVERRNAAFDAAAGVEPGTLPSGEAASIDTRALTVEVARQLDVAELVEKAIGDGKLDGALREAVGLIAEEGGPTEDQGGGAPSAGKGGKPSGSGAKQEGGGSS